MMPPEPTAPERNFSLFLERVRQSGTVWGLCLEEDWAYCDSDEYEDTDVLVFWSEREGAQKHAHGEWSRHKPRAIELEDFLTHWLPGMDQDGALVGPEWDPEFGGLELEPSEVADRLCEEA